MTNTTKQITVVVVDDSAFMRKALTMMLESDPGIKVIGTACDGEEGIEKVRSLKPDLVTMDIEMPRMDGLAALRYIMANHPVPVMMVSSVTTDGASATLDALEMGAVDFIPKQLSYVSLDIVKIKEELLTKIKDIARRKHILMARYLRARMAKTIANENSRPGAADAQLGMPSRPAVGRRLRTRAVKVVAIGSSTGGPPALQHVISRLPRNFPVGIVVAQHMPATFTKSLAERLDDLSRVSVGEAVDGEPLEPGRVLIAPGGRHLTVKKRAHQAWVCVSDEPADTLYKPCVDVTMHSVADSFQAGSLGVILTGMGENGLAGIRDIKARGGDIIAQSEESCVVYGMPRAVIEAGLADRVAAIEDVATEILAYF